MKHMTYNLKFIIGLMILSVISSSSAKKSKMPVIKVPAIDYSDLRWNKFLGGKPNFYYDEASKIVAKEWGFTLVYK